MESRTLVLMVNWGKFSYKVRGGCSNSNLQVLKYESVPFKPRIPAYPVTSLFDTRPVMLCDPQELCLEIEASNSDVESMMSQC